MRIICIICIAYFVVQCVESECIVHSAWRVVKHIAGNIVACIVPYHTSYRSSSRKLYVCVLFDFGCGCGCDCDCDCDLCYSLVVVVVLLRFIDGYTSPMIFRFAAVRQRYTYTRIRNVDVDMDVDVGASGIGTRAEGGLDLRSEAVTGTGASAGTEVVVAYAEGEVVCRWIAVVEKVTTFIATWLIFFLLEATY